MDKKVLSPCSLVLPVYNSKELLFKNLPGFIEMLGSEDELIIIDDGSKDLQSEDRAVLRSIDMRVRIVRQEHLGLVSALNLGLQLAANEFVARIDVDDYSPPERLQIQKGMLQSHPNCGAVFCDYRFIGSDETNLGSLASPLFPYAMKISMLNPQRTPHPGVMFRKSYVLEVGGYKLEDYPVEDLALWVRLAQKFEIRSTPEVLLNYTISASSITGRNRLLMLEKVLGLRPDLVRILEKEFSVSIIRRIFADYANFSKSEERQILLIRDLITFTLVAKRSIRFWSLYSIILSILQLRYRHLTPLKTLFFEHQKRTYFRK